MDFQFNDDDFNSVATMAEFSFGSVITDNVFVQRHLRALVKRLVVQTECRADYTIKAVHSILSNFGVDIKALKKHEELRMFIEAAFIHLLRRRGVHEDAMFDDIRTLIDNYPTFGCLDSKELTCLLNYRNHLVLALKYIPPEQNRDYLLDLITRLTEGALVRHVPGSGATLSTRNRIAIYRKEGGVKQRVRPPREEGVLAPRRKLRLLLKPAAHGELPPVHLTLKRGHSLDESVYEPSKVAKLEGDEIIIKDGTHFEDLFQNFDGVGLEEEAELAFPLYIAN